MRLGQHRQSPPYTENRRCVLQFLLRDADWVGQALAEQVVIAAGGTSFQACVLRPAVIFGEGDPQLIPSVAACIPKRETPYIIGDGCNLWDTVYVGNVADAHILAAENLLSTKTAAGEIFFIQNNEPIAFRAFCLAVWKQLGHIPPFEFTIPASLCWFLGVLAEFFTWLSGATTTLNRGSIKDAYSVRYASGHKAERILGFTPRIGLEEGLRISCEVRQPILFTLGKLQCTTRHSP